MAKFTVRIIAGATVHDFEVTADYYDADESWVRFWNRVEGTVDKVVARISVNKRHTIIIDNLETRA